MVIRIAVLLQVGFNIIYILDLQTVKNQWNFNFLYRYGKQYSTACFPADVHF